MPPAADRPVCSQVGSDGLTDGSASDEEQGDDDSEDQAEQSHGEVVQTLDALGVSVMSHVVRGGHEGRHKREDQGNAELTKQSERNGKADCRVGLEARSDSENGCHDAADDGVRRLSASDRHVADRHELIGTTHEKTGVEVAKDKTDDGAGDDGLIERLEEVELVDCRDERDDEDQSDLDDRVFHLAPPFKMYVRTLDITYRTSGFQS